MVVGILKIIAELGRSISEILDEITGIREGLSREADRRLGIGGVA